MDAPSPTDAWTVRSVLKMAASKSVAWWATLVAHWNGTAWSVTDAANPGAPWVIGSFGGSYGHPEEQRTLTEHWGGHAWSVVPSPRHGGFEAVTHDASGNVWAAGDRWNGTETLTFTERWDGMKWIVVRTENPGKKQGGDFLLSVAAASPSSAWVGGYFGTGELRPAGESIQTYSTPSP